MNEASQLGPYELIRRIGIGGMAEIYLAKTTGIGGFEKFLALKVIHPKFVEDQDFIDMLIDEAKIAVQLNHTNVGQIFDLGCIDGTYFIAMEYVDGKDLYQLTVHCSEEEILIPFDVIAFIGKEIASGLHYAHGKSDSTGQPLNLIHRDVSPQNVLLSYEGQVKIVDFGIAKATQRRQQTESGVIKGKFHYMAPEQAWGDELDGRSDVFSAGICLYEMVAGEMLYNEERALVLLDKVRKAEIPNLREKRPDIPPDLEAIILKALARDKDERYRSAGEFHGALSAFLYGHWPSFSRHRVGEFVRNAFSKSAVIDAPAAVAEVDIPNVDSQASEPLMQADEFDRTMGRSVIFALSDLSQSNDAQSPEDDSTNAHDYNDHDQTIASSYVLDGIPPEFLASLEDEDVPTGAHISSDLDDWDESAEKTELLDTSIFNADADGDESEFGGSSDSPTSLFDQPILAHPKTLPRQTPSTDQNQSVESRPSESHHSHQHTTDENSAARPKRKETNIESPTPGHSTPSAFESAPSEPKPTLEDIRRKKARAKILEAHIPNTSASERTNGPAAVTTPTPGRKVARVTTRTTIDPRRTQRLNWQGLLASLKTPQGVTAMALFALTVYAITTILPGTLEPIKRVGHLEIMSVPVGARILVDGQHTGRVTNGTMPGFELGAQHTVRIELKGYEPQEKSITITGTPNAAGHFTMQQRFFLRRTAGVINVVSSPPGAEIYMDGRYVGTTPMVLRDQDRQKDERLLLVRKDGYREKKAKLVWGDRERIDFNATLETLKATEPKKKPAKDTQPKRRRRKR